MDLDYARDTKIDESALDVEWLAQTDLARRYGKHAAFTRKRAKEAAERVKVLQAELIREATQNPKGCTGKDKPTVGDVEAYYRTRPRYQELKQELIDAEYEADYADYVREEMSFSRKKALENLVVLHGQQYFAGPSVPRDLSREWEQRQHQKRVDAAVSGGLHRRNK